MKTLLLIVFVGFASLVNAQSYKLDTSASTLNWTGYSEVGDYSQSGTLKCSSGEMTLDEGEVAAFDMVVDMTSLSHENAELKKHLKQKDFFHVKKHPEAQLVFVEKVGDKFMFNLTIRGKSQQIEVPINLEETEEGFVSEGTIIIDRTKFDIKYNSSDYFQDLGNYAIKNDFDLAYKLVFKVM